MMRHQALGSPGYHRTAVGSATSSFCHPVVALSEALGMRPPQAHGNCGLGALYTKIGRWARAHAGLSAAIERYCATGMTCRLPRPGAALAGVEGE